MEPVPEILASQDRKLKKIIGDGNCLFRALSQFIHGSEDFHAVMRQQLVDFVHKNKQVFVPFVLSGTIDTHLLHMKHDRIWGTQVELQAVATLIQRDIFVLTDCFGGTTKTRWMKYTPLDPTELVYPPEEEYPRSLDSINHLELCHTYKHYDCIVSKLDGKLPLTTPKMESTQTQIHTIVL